MTVENVAANACYVSKACPQSHFPELFVMPVPAIEQALANTDGQDSIRIRDFVKERALGSTLAKWMGAFTSLDDSIVLKLDLQEDPETGGEKLYVVAQSALSWKQLKHVYTQLISDLSATGRLHILKSLGFTIES